MNGEEQQANVPRLAPGGPTPRLVGPEPTAASVRERLGYVRWLRKEADEMQAKAAKETYEVLKQAQQTEGVTFEEAAQLVGLTKDGAYKALRRGQK